MNKQVILNCFDLFWKEYPWKCGKIAARKAWLKIPLTSELFAKILNAVRWQKKTLRWLKDDGQFIPLPTTWLNQGRWDDEPVEKPIKRYDCEGENRRRIKDECQSYLEGKTNQALLDIKNDGGQLANVAGWLIDEILEKRKHHGK